jgi:hypothetical protein
LQAKACDLFTRASELSFQLLRHIRFLAARFEGPVDSSLSHYRHVALVFVLLLVCMEQFVDTNVFFASKLFHALPVFSPSSRRKGFDAVVRL